MGGMVGWGGEIKSTVPLFVRKSSILLLPSIKLKQPLQRTAGMTPSAPAARSLLPSASCVPGATASFLHLSCMSQSPWSFLKSRAQATLQTN